MGTNEKAWGVGFKRMIGDESLGDAYGIAVDNTTKQLHICDIADVGTDWGLSNDSHASVYIHSATTPESNYLKMYHDATDGFIDAVGATRLSLRIAGTTELSISASEIEITSGTDIQFLGDDGILDSAGNEVMLVEAVSSAVNYLNVKNAATGDPIVLECFGSADKGFRFNNDQDEAMLTLSAIPTGTDYLDIKSGDGSTDPVISALGGSADIDINITPKGTGKVDLGATCEANAYTVGGTAGTDVNYSSTVTGITVVKGIVTSVTGS